jgi:creatinine amidohydrolase
MSYALTEMSWPDVDRALARDARLILPIGALEQHGPHLPLGANILIAERTAVEVSERLGVLRAPTFSYGATPNGGPFAGAAGLRRKTLHRAVNELLAHWEADGVAELVMVTAHRYEPHIEALLMALTDRAVNSVYDLYRIEVTDLLDADPEAEHAGELETSLMLHLAPELVQIDRIRDFNPPPGASRRYTRGRVPAPPPGSDGVLGRPSLASAEKGAAVFQRYVDAVTEGMRGG